jgi:hypothetical protein
MAQPSPTAAGGHVRDRQLELVCFGSTIAASLIALATGWGFTVDDALISSRVAHHIASGLGYRFNPMGPVTDCVTPLGWAVLIAPLSTEGAWQGMLNARWLGVVCHLATAAVLAHALAKARVPTRSVVGVSLVLAVSLPWGAWASSGMETPLITLLAACSLLAGRMGLGAAALASALRPELIPWAMTLALASSAPTPGRRLGRLAAVLAPALAVAVIRASVFGHAAPLAVFAKPSDLTHGLRYIATGLLLTGLPLLLPALGAYRQLPRAALSHAFALLAHAAAVTAAGGDWMALFRLLVPVLPNLAYVAALVLARERPRWYWAKLGLAISACMLLQVSHGTNARSVLDARRALVEAGSIALSGAKVVGTLDVGWVGASGDFEVVDFAGVTDPEVALLPGGHTSKHLPPDFLYRRKVDAIALLTRPNTANNADWTELPFARMVERRVGQFAGQLRFRQSAWLPLAETDQHYLILERSPDVLASTPGQQRSANP